MARWMGWLLGLDRVTSVQAVRPSLGAEWVTSGSGPFWLCCAILVLVLLVVMFYAKFQRRGSIRTRRFLAAWRIALLVLLLATLAEPMLRVTVSRTELPNLFLVFDGTASMGIRDRLDDTARTALAQATGLTPAARDPAELPTRQEYVRAWLQHAAAGILAELVDTGKCHLRIFIFDGPTSSRVRPLYVSRAISDRPDLPALSNRLTTDGQVTALGTVLRDLARQPGSAALAGVVLVSDFVQNSGEHPLSASRPSERSAAETLQVPIYAIGVGAGQTRGVVLEVETDPKIRRGEKTSVRVQVRQTGLDGQTVRLQLSARPFSGPGDSAPPSVVEEREITLQLAQQLVEFSYFPRQAGQFELRAEATAHPAEGNVVHHRATRRIQVIDDFIRLLYVAHEPSWEWRFVKEVFHRDPAVGLEGFRTYLAASDPRVRQSNPLFLPSLATNRAEFFTNDVIFLDDMPRASLSPRFCEMVEQFVRQLGGGLIVLAGPRFGPGQLADTPLADMLPVIIDPLATLRDQTPFRPKLTDRAREFPFMQLESEAPQTAKAWENLGLLPWYQPVANKHERAIVLAEHPTDKCQDGRTPQPLIAIRRYGEGEVLYLGFNEMWRLRRGYGEQYYRRFWLPIIDRLGLGHALGPDKRFVARMDRYRYRVEDEAVLTVRAYDGNYDPLDPDQLPGGALEAELVRLVPGQDAVPVANLQIGALRPGNFETRFPVHGPGRYRARVKDPITDRYAAWEFEVMSASAELLSATRDESLQQQLADVSHGRSGTLTDLDTLLSKIELTPYQEIEEHAYPLWTTPLWFAGVIALMLGEWLLRKWAHLK